MDNSLTSADRSVESDSIALHSERRRGTEQQPQQLQTACSNPDQDRSSPKQPRSKGSDIVQKLPGATQRRQRQLIVSESPLQFFQGEYIYGPEERERTLSARASKRAP